MRRLTLILIFVLATSAWAQDRKTKLSTLLTQGCVVYYGPEPQDKTNFTRAQVVILEPSHWSTRSLRRLREQGKTVIGYLSIGEITATARTNRNYQILSKNSDWNSLRIDPSDPRWKKNILRRTRLARDRNLDGMMLDTVDITIAHPEAKDSMAELISDVRAELAGGYLMMNRGFSVLDSVHSEIDGVVFENANNSGFSANDREWVRSQCQSLQRYGMPVLVLDYQEHSSQELTEGMATEYGWSYFLAPSQTLTRPLFDHRNEVEHYR